MDTETPDKSIIPIRIEDEMRNSYMDYSMSVIIGRALPDVRDGLKPVHRRILYAMHQMNLTASRRYSKCAGTVGEVLKKFHPHGDSAVYDALVRMAQHWNLRYLMVDGQGNFGSVDGDKAAAYRYTEARMTRYSGEMLVDIEKDTVGFSPNFDGTVDEPMVLPCRAPNLLVNGADGIAVGMATKIPPHNITEVINGCLAVIESPEIGTAELMEIIPGPDFPTAGIICGRQGIYDAYDTGRGRIILRGNAFVETQKSGRESIIIDELPYQVNKARLVEQIADLVRSKRLEGISELRDESDRQGMRVVIELKQDAYSEVVLNFLYKHTALQSTFGTIMLAIVDNQPKVLKLKKMLQLFVDHRRSVILRRTRFDLNKAKERAHILEGFKKALDILDELIAFIRASKNPAEARAGLQDKFEFTERQSIAILELKLQRLTGMERQKILDELQALTELIERLQAILASEALLIGVVRNELIEVRDKYGDDRRTVITDAAGDFDPKDLVAKEEQVITLSHVGYIKRCKTDEWRKQGRGGKGTAGIKTRDDDYATSLLVANTHSMLLVFTSKGIVYPLPAYKVPETSRSAKGRPVNNLVPLGKDEKIAALVVVESMEIDVSLFFATKLGLVKRAPLSHFKNLRQGGLIATTINNDDELVFVKMLDSTVESDAMLFTREGKCIRFRVTDAPEPRGRSARGNFGIRLVGGDVVVDGLLAPAGQKHNEEALEDDTTSEVGDEEEVEESSETTLLTVTSGGFGKRTPFDQYRVQGRYGKGIISIKLSETAGKVVGVRQVASDDQLILASDTGNVIRIGAKSVRRVKSRSSRGVRIMRLKRKEELVDLAVFAPEDETDLDNDVFTEIEGVQPTLIPDEEHSNEMEE